MGTKLIKKPNWESILVNSILDYDYSTYNLYNKNCSHFIASILDSIYENSDFTDFTNEIVNINHSIRKYAGILETLGTKTNNPCRGDIAVSHNPFALGICINNKAAFLGQDGKLHLRPLKDLEYWRLN